MTTLGKLNTAVGNATFGYRTDSAYLSDRFWNSIRLECEDDTEDHSTKYRDDEYAFFPASGLRLQNKLYNTKSNDLDLSARRDKNRIADKTILHLPERATGKPQCPPIIRIDTSLPVSAPEFTPGLTSTIQSPHSPTGLMTVSPLSPPADWTPRPESPMRSNLLGWNPVPFSPRTTMLNEASSFLDTLVRLTKSPTGSPVEKPAAQAQDDHTIFESDVLINFIEEVKRAGLWDAPQVPVRDPIDRPSVLPRGLNCVMQPPTPYERPATCANDVEPSSNPRNVQGVIEPGRLSWHG